MHTSIKRKKKKGPITKYSAILLTISITNPFSLIPYVLKDSQHYLFILWLFSSIWTSFDGISASVCFDLIFTASVHGEPRD
jgi:hypothetical protein